MDQISLSGRNAVDDIHRINPFVFCIIARSVNGNVMCYECKNGVISYFWINLDPKYKNLTRVEKPGVLEWSPYGWTQKKLSDSTYEVTLRQVPSKPIFVNTEPLKYDGEHVGRPCARGYTTLNGQKCYLNYAWVEMSGSAILPKVIHVDMFGHNRDGCHITERIQNK